MLTRITIGSVFLFFLMLSMTAMAADFVAPPGRWWYNQKLIQRLKLTQDQIEQIDSAFRSSRLKMIQLKSRVETQQFQLETLVEKKNICEAEILKQYEKLESARSELGTERFRFFLWVRKIVGHEKFMKLLQLKKARDRRRTKGH